MSVNFWWKQSIHPLHILSTHHSSNAHLGAAAEDVAGGDAAHFREDGVFKQVTVPTSGREPINKKIRKCTTPQEHYIFF